jgi:glycine hydroxymethyltransferase
MLVDLRPQGSDRRSRRPALDRAAITCNANPIPSDPKKAAYMSGLRFGVSACTTRGFGPVEV